KGAVNPEDSSVKSVFDSSFYTYIALSCPKLKKLHLSDNFQAFLPFVTTELLERLVSMFPLVTDWGLSSLMQDSMMFSQMRSFTNNVITTLEIVGLGRLKHDTLHRYLCNSPQLLHLVAPGALFCTSLFDLEGILNDPILHNSGTISYSSTGLDSSLIRKIWACHNLKTLHLKFTYKVESEALSEMHSRLLFGYISKVCPRLQDLAIDCKQLALQHNGGFCLLTRLHDLRRLKIIHNIRFIPEQTELGWILKTISPSLRIKLPIWIAKFKLLESSELYARRPFQSNSGTRKFFGYNNTHNVTGDYIIDGIDMRYIGRLKDIAVCYQERLDNNLVSFPNLERITFSEFGVIEEINKYRPELELTRR
ncbi:hypothetical protein BGZ76_005337, partial [Entomortierella beljakovae]